MFTDTFFLALISVSFVAFALCLAYYASVADGDHDN